MDNSNTERLARIRRLYPELPESELPLAAENLRQYIAAALRIYEAICADPERYAQLERVRKSSESLG